MRIDLTPSEKERLLVFARQAGLSPAELMKRTALEHLPSSSETNKETVEAKLRRWQEQDGITLMPKISTQTLFAQWDKEDALMTEEDRNAEDRLWEDLENAFHRESGLRLRSSG
ncbi:MAG: hypothetical protein H7308_16525 [Chthonomonadaceae bacterium]|nr:hypothetical protein [Chthonomonadaceae bacterium]